MPTNPGQKNGPAPSRPANSSVRVTKDHLVFCSGHFISYEGDRCERLHGHNYRTTVEIEGLLDVNYYVFDFIALKHLTKAITDELDHRMLLPTRNPHIKLGGTAGPCTCAIRTRVAVPAWRLRPPAHRKHHRRAAGPLHWPRLLDDLRKAYGSVPEVIRVEVEENIGQSATWTMLSPHQPEA